LYLWGFAHTASKDVFRLYATLNVLIKDSLLQQISVGYQLYFIASFYSIVAHPKEQADMTPQLFSLFVVLTATLSCFVSGTVAFRHAGNDVPSRIQPRKADPSTSTIPGALLSRRYADILDTCYPGHTCPGLYASCPKNQAQFDIVKTAIQDAGYLANAALRALKADITHGPAQPAPHYYFFFENTATVREYVTSIFQNIANCIAGNCPFSLAFCGDNYGWCPQTPGTLEYAPSPAQSLNGQGGVVFLCPAALNLTRNPLPCSTAGGADSPSYALLRALVQLPGLTDPNNEWFSTSKVGVSSITEMGNRGKWSVSSLGWGTNGDGLMARGKGNAENFARFASWSWDLGYGGNPWTGGNCSSERWDPFVTGNGLVPIS